MELKFEKNGFFKRLKSMLKVDLRRAFTTPLFYLVVGIALAMPVLILVMTTMMDGTVSTNPQTGAETVIEGFDSVWQIIGSVSADANAGATAGMDMSLTAMCNINMLFMLIPVPVCIFIADDFRSGYAKNLFTVRAKKSDYIISKSVIGFIFGASMLIAFFLGSMVGGAICSLPFALEGFNALNLIACMLAKLFLVLIFVAVAVLGSVIAKPRLWLSIILSLAFGMLLFTMIPMISPLDSTFLNALLCLVGGVGMAVGLGAISNTVLSKTAII